MEGIQVSTQAAGSQNQISIIKVGGYIDTTTSSEVERALNGLLKQGRYQIIIDLGNVDYISSAGWGIFISEIKAIRENNGDLKLVQMIPDVYEIFELLEFHHILDVHDSLPEAVQRFEENQFVEMVPTAKSSTEGAAANPFRVDSAQGAAPQAQPQQAAPREPQQAAQPQIPRQAPAAAAEAPDPRRMSTEEKIRQIVANNPDLGAFKINKRLNSPEYGYTKVGWFGVRSLLNKLGLSSRKSRRDFAQRQ